MPKKKAAKKPKKAPSRDVNEIAAGIVAKATKS
jgi:hypothetical protein